MPFLPPNHQCRSTGGTVNHQKYKILPTVKQYMSNTQKPCLLSLCFLFFFSFFLFRRRWPDELLLLLELSSLSLLHKHRIADYVAEADSINFFKSTLHKQWDNQDVVLTSARNKYVWYVDAVREDTPEPVYTLSYLISVYLTFRLLTHWIQCTDAVGWMAGTWRASSQ